MWCVFVYSIFARADLLRDYSCDLSTTERPIHVSSPNHDDHHRTTTAAKAEHPTTTENAALSIQQIDAD